MIHEDCIIFCIVVWNTCNAKDHLNIRNNYWQDPIFYPWIAVWLFVYVEWPFQYFKSTRVLSVPAEQGHVISPQTIDIKQHAPSREFALIIKPDMLYAYRS